MVRKLILRRGLYLFAGVLVGAPAVLVSVAADAHGQHHHGTRAVHFAPSNVSAPRLSRGAVNGTRQPQDPKAPRADDAPHNAPTGIAAGTGGKQPSGASKEIGTAVPAKDANAPDFHTKDLGPTDTRITVQPRLHGAGPATARQAKRQIGPVGSRYSHVRHTFTPGKTGHVTRNAIGLPITPRSAPNAALVHSPTAAAPGVSTNGSNGVVKPNPSLDHFAVSRPGPFVSGTGAGRPAINGSNLARRGFVPATLGGPTKNVVVGINGSTIRPKR